MNFNFEIDGTKFIDKEELDDDYCGYLRSAFQNITFGTLLYFVGFLCNSDLSFEEFVAELDDTRYHKVSSKWYIVGDSQYPAYTDTVEEWYHNGSCGMKSSLDFLLTLIRLNIYNVTVETTCDLPWQSQDQYQAHNLMFYKYWAQEQFSTLIVYSIINVMFVYFMLLL